MQTPLADTGGLPPKLPATLGSTPLSNFGSGGKSVQTFPGQGGGGGVLPPNPLPVEPPLPVMLFGFTPAHAAERPTKTTSERNPSWKKEM
jgi:hypothetical protein